MRSSFILSYYCNNVGHCLSYDWFNSCTNVKINLEISEVYTISNDSSNKCKWRVNFKYYWINILFQYPYIDEVNYLCSCFFNELSHNPILLFHFSRKTILEVQTVIIPYVFLSSLFITVMLVGKKLVFQTHKIVFLSFLTIILM